MAVVGRKLYALGGMLDGGYASLVEMYDAEDDNWIEVDPMSQARCNPGIAVAGGKIYVVGGLGENLLGPPGPLKTVEYYDVRMISNSLVKWFCIKCIIIILLLFEYF